MDILVLALLIIAWAWAEVWSMNEDIKENGNKEDDKDD